MAQTKPEGKTLAMEQSRKYRLSGYVAVAVIWCLLAIGVFAAKAPPAQSQRAVACAR